MLRLLRDERGLSALIGDWYGGGAVIGFEPVRTAAADEDPFGLAVDGSTESGFGGGWIGYWGYRLGSRIERLPHTPPRPTPLPDFHLSYYDHVLRLDAATSTWWFEALVTAERKRHLDAELERMRSLVASGEPERRAYSVEPFTMTPLPAEHLAAVDETLRHITAGDIFQANLCTRLQAAYDGDPLDVFCAGVDALTPRFAAYVATDGGAVASLSPELFLHRTGRTVRTSPIKGTAPLTSDVRTLQASWKNRAENIMIVDLMRNDLGRVCEAGSVQVPDEPRAERHTGVWHLVSDVVGRLRADADDGDLMRATFPPGSVTGAPKVRAMELIDELETTGREVYTGALGYVGAAGLELNVAIRTFEFSGDTVWLGVGGGIVADSRPDDELRECLVKATPLLDAIGARVDDDVRAAVEAMGVREAEGGTPVVSTSSGASARSRPNPDAGVFETMYVEHGRAAHLDAHLARLASSLNDVYGVVAPAGLVARVESSAAALTGPHRLRVSVVPSQQGESIAATPITEPPKPWELVPVVVPGGLGGHKWGDRRVLDEVEPERGAWTATRDALLVDTDGSVLETGRGSLFVVDDHAVHTPLADGRILPGVTRRRVLDLLARAGVPAYERRIDLDDLRTAREVFVTNAVRGAVPVERCAGVGAWRLGHVTEWIARRLSAPAPVLEPQRPPGRRVLLIDNYDSFVYNLDQYCQELGARTTVIRNDAATVDEVESWVRAGAYDRVVISPGPGTPGDAGISTDVVRRLGSTVPILGVCLGHQCIGEAYGAVVRRAPSVVHGKSSLVRHDGGGVFASIDGPLASGRYHSLVVDEASLPDELLATAHTASHVLMGVRHRTHPVEGVQLHPESILTRHGHAMIANFLAAQRI